MLHISEQTGVGVQGFVLEPGNSSGTLTEHQMPSSKLLLLKSQSGISLEKTEKTNAFVTHKVTA